MNGKQDFHKTLLGAVDEGLTVLGESVMHTIYYHVEKNYQVKRGEVPNRIAAFHEALKDLFGVGTNVIENLIAKNLYSRLGLSFEEHKKWSLVDYFDDAKKNVSGKTLETAGFREELINKIIEKLS